MKVSTMKFQLRKNESVERDRSTLKIQLWSEKQMTTVRKMITTV